jgi:stage III sporulation protein AG
MTAQEEAGFRKKHRVHQKMYDTSDGNAPFVKRENMPEIEGVIVAAQGGGDGTVEADITSAIEALLGVAAHKIKVMKMS